MSDCLSPSASWPWLSRSVLSAMWLRRRRSVLSALVLVCIVLLRVKQWELRAMRRERRVRWEEEKKKYIVGSLDLAQNDNVYLFIFFEPERKWETCHYIQIYIGRFRRFRFRSLNSVGFTASALDCLSPSTSRPRLSRSVPLVVWLRQRPSVLSTSVLVCIVLHTTLTFVIWRTPLEIYIYLFIIKKGSDSIIIKVKIIEGWQRYYKFCYVKFT